MQMVDELKTIRRLLVDLQNRTYRAGLPALEYLLEMAVVEADVELKKQRKKSGLSTVTNIQSRKIINGN